MRSRLPLVLSSMALVIAIFGSTPFGRAAIATAVPLAKRAYLADTAKNAIKVDNIKASRTPTPGMLLPLDATGKLPESVGAIGPKGDKGDKGDRGAAKVVVRSIFAATPVTAFTTATATCDSGEKATGGGFAHQGTAFEVVKSEPSTSDGNSVPDGNTATAWTVEGYNTAANYTSGVSVFVICASR